MTKFVHLHVHTEFSLLDGFARIDMLAKKLKEDGMSAVAITDHGVMYGVVEFYKEMKRNGIKPIIGVEAYVAPRSRFDKDSVRDKNSGHLILLVKNKAGYLNLIKLVSSGFIEGFYRKPRIDYNILEKHSEGLICLSACINGHIQDYLKKDEYEEAKKLALRLGKMFGKDSFYLELQDHSIPVQRDVNLQLVRLSNDTGIPLVCTNDVHYTRKSDSGAHDALLCMQTGKYISDTDRMKFETEEFYLKSGDEMANLFAFAPESIENTVKIADMCEFDFEFGAHHLPKFIFDENSGKYIGETSIKPEDLERRGVGDYLEKLCNIGMCLKYGQVRDKENFEKSLKERLDYEISIINSMGYGNYFLIVWDFIRFAKEQGICVGPGRGSCGGSIVAYVLDITDVDPVKYDLIFERFLNPERITMPDIDIDFEDTRRSEVIDYVIKKYGVDHVAQIITFGTLGARAAIRDVGRVMQIPYATVDRLAKEVPFAVGMTIDKAIRSNPEIIRMIDSDTDVKNIIELAKKVEGIPRHTSTHAAGVVISEFPVDSYVPLTLQEGSVSTQFQMTLLEELGLLKMDFLGLRTLSVIREAKRLANLDYTSTPQGDKAAYELISRGNTLGIFQLESSGMRKFMTDLRPGTLEDIIAGISLYRPGPMDSIPEYIRNKNNPQDIVYPHEKLKDILSVTYGCIVYQEQVMRIVRELAGYSYGRSDLVRRAMSKKKMEVMEEERRSFIYGKVGKNGEIEVEGCIRRGISEEVATKVFDDMTDFAKYAFNKSHAAGYALIAYETAYLKANYPAEFMAGAMSTVNSLEKLASYINDAIGMGIKVLLPSVNMSASKFTVETDTKSYKKFIRYGLLSLKGIGHNVIDSLIAEREKRGFFTDFKNFIDRTVDSDVGKKAVESLIKAGALDEFGLPRKEMLYNYEKMYDSAFADKKVRDTGQLSMFETIPSGQSDYIKMREFVSKVKLGFEREMLGVYISGHPLSCISDKILRTNTIRLEEIGELTGDTAEGDDRRKFDFLENKRVKLIVMIESVTTKITRNGQTMAFARVEDLGGSIEAVIFPALFQKNRSIIAQGEFIEIRGRLDISDESGAKIIADEIFGIAQNTELKSLYIRFGSIKDYDYDSIYDIVSMYEGDSKVVVYIEEGRWKRECAGIGINICEESIIRLKNRFGDKNIIVK